MSRDSESPSAWYFINYLLATLEIFKTSKTIKSTEARDFRKLYASILSSKNETGRVERKIATGQEREEEKRYRGNATHDGRFRQTNVACSSKTSTVLRSRDAYACLLIARTDRTVSKKKKKEKTGRQRIHVQPPFSDVSSVAAFGAGASSSSLSPISFSSTSPGRTCANKFPRATSSNWCRAAVNPREIRLFASSFSLFSSLCIFIRRSIFSYFVSNRCWTEEDLSCLNLKSDWGLLVFQDVTFW